MAIGSGTSAGKRSGPVDRQVGARIRLRRNLLGLSQTELGRAVGVTFQQIQKYENGQNRVGASRLQRIAQALDTVPGWFFERAAGANGVRGRRHGPSIEAAVLAFMSDRQGVKLIRAWGGVPRRVRGAIVNLARSLAEEADGGPA